MKTKEKQNIKSRKPQTSSGTFEVVSVRNNSHEKQIWNFQYK